MQIWNKLLTSQNFLEGFVNIRFSCYDNYYLMLDYKVSNLLLIIEKY